MIQQHLWSNHPSYSQVMMPCQDEYQRSLTPTSNMYITSGGQSQLPPQKIFWLYRYKSRLYSSSSIRRQQVPIFKKLLSLLMELLHQEQVHPSWSFWMLLGKKNIVTWHLHNGRIKQWIKLVSTPVDMPVTQIFVIASRCTKPNFHYKRRVKFCPI